MKLNTFISMRDNFVLVFTIQRVTIKKCSFSTMLASTRAHFSISMPPQSVSWFKHSPSLLTLCVSKAIRRMLQSQMSPDSSSYTRDTQSGERTIQSLFLLPILTFGAQYHGQTPTLACTYCPQFQVHRHPCNLLPQLR